MPRPFPTRPNAYRLRAIVGGVETWEAFESLAALARGVCVRLSFRDSPLRYAGHQETRRLGGGGTVLLVRRTHVTFDLVLHTGAIELAAFAPNGAPLQILGLEAAGLAALERARKDRRVWFRGADYCGWGPVPGVRKWRGGRRFFRSPRTQSERVLNAGADAMEPSARAARRGRELPSDRDDLGRGVQRCWKVQHKGRKAWDRA